MVVSIFWVVVGKLWAQCDLKLTRLPAIISPYLAKFIT